MNRVVKRFDKSLIGDFYRLHSDENKAGWCFCVAWWSESWDGWSERTAGENQRFRDELLTLGEYDGYLLYVEDKPVGWCQVGPRDRLRKLTRQFDLAPSTGTWAITCFLIKTDRRRSGLALYLLQQVLADLQTEGVQRVEAYPKRGPDTDVMDMWNGPESMYLRAGFYVLKDDTQRPVLAIELTKSAL